MFGKNPIELYGMKISGSGIMQALRIAIIAELDAINLYIQLAESIEDEKIKKIFLDIAREEKTHVGEFLALLKILDEEQVKELEKGYKEVKELMEE